MTEPIDRRDRVCVVGAGASGLTAAKNLRERGYDVDVYELADDVGGNWYFEHPLSRVYRSTHVISSKPFTAFPDFPMPDEWPDYPHHRELHEYFRRYARHFGLYDVIEFNTEVVRAVPGGGSTTGEHEGWDVTIRRGDGTEETFRYRALISANGHNWSPKMPDYPGLADFTGGVMHSAQYKDPSVLEGRRVLVVGAGNTGCDIAVEAAQNAEHCLHSTRRGYWYAQKYTFGRPADQVADVFFGLNLPTPVIQKAFELTIRSTIGDFERHGLKEPDHRILETHPIVNSQLVYYVGHGEITPKDDIERFEGDRVVFVDGTSDQVDLVIFATGYLIDFPFIDHALLNWVGDPGYPMLYRNCFHPDFDDLFVVGLFQPDSGIFNLAHWQAVAVAHSLTAKATAPQAFARFRREVRDNVDEKLAGGVDLIASTRHYVEVEHMAFIRALDELVNGLVAAIQEETSTGLPEGMRCPPEEPVMRRLDWALPAPPVKRELVESHPEAATDKPPLLLIHGLHEAAWAWERWMPAAAERGWPCYALSLRGHGGSGGGEDLARTPLRHFEHDVLQAIAGLPQPPVIVGHSTGGLLTQRILHRYPARAGVLLAPLSPWAGWRVGVNALRLHPPTFLRAITGKEVDPPRRFLFSDRLPQDEADVHLERMGEESMLVNLESQIPRRPLQTKAPVLVVGAADDALIDVVDLVRLARHYGTRPHVFRGMGHALMLDVGWESVLDLVLGWLERTLPQPHHVGRD